ncbi:MAG: YccF domain-containing protein [bacterium]|nr:YccF domain-containing protein [bacterium]
MILFLNILWFVFGGAAAALAWALAGCFMFVTVVGIPFAIGAFRIAAFVAWPFGRRVVPCEAVGERRVFGTMAANVVWFLLAGLWLAIAHALLGVVYCVTIIGIPWGIQHLKIAGICFAPLGVRIVGPGI